MLRVFVSNKLIQPSESIDPKKSQQIFVSSKALGSGCLCKVEGPCSVASCGRSEKSSKYYVIKNSTIEIQNIILTNNPNLFEDSILCQKCYLRLKRGQNLIDSSKPKKCQKLDRPKSIISVVLNKNQNTILVQQRRILRKFSDPQLTMKTKNLGQILFFSVRNIIWSCIIF